MQFHDHCPAVTWQALDDPGFPQRAVPVESAFHDVGGESEQGRVVAGVGKRDAVNVMGDVEVCGVDPFGRFKIEGMRAQHLRESGHAQRSLRQTGEQRLFVGNRPLEHGQGTDREVDMTIGILGFQEARIKH